MNFEFSTVMNDFSLWQETKIMAAISNVAILFIKNSLVVYLNSTEIPSAKSVPVAKPSAIMMRYFFVPFGNENVLV